MPSQTPYFFCSLLMTLCNQAISADLQVSELSKGAFRGENGAPFLQNLSGSTFDGKNIVLVDDGGISIASPIFFLDSTKSKKIRPLDVELERTHTDLEGITWHKGSYLITTSWTDNEPLEVSSRLLTRLEVNEKCKCIKSQKTVSLYPEAIEALKPLYSSGAYGRVMTADAKLGGVNIEGLSSSHRMEKDEVVFGFRSPLADEKFGSPELNPEYSLQRGKAIALWVENPMTDSPSFRTELLDLGGLGIRSIEYAPSLSAYAIIAGSADRRDDYQLWLWKPDSSELTLQKASLEGLCRPESVSEFISKKNAHLVVISERSGAACEGTKYDYISIPIR